MSNEPMPAQGPVDVTVSDLAEAIKHATEVADREGCTECGQQHRKLAAWLMELQGAKSMLPLYRELVGHMSVEQIKAYGQACREAALEEAARLCNGEQWMMSGKKSIDYINAFNEGCTDCEAVIRRLT